MIEVEFNSKILRGKAFQRIGLGCAIKANCLYVEPVPEVEIPLVGGLSKEF